MDYLTKCENMLNAWVKYAQQDLYIPLERSDLICYGAGYDGWGMQTHQKGFAGFAVTAVSEFATKIPKDVLLDQSIRMLRYMLETHIEGSFQCVDGIKWGHTWISALGTERAMHAIDGLRPYLYEADKTLLKKVLISEADWILNAYQIVAGKVAENGKNKPESNLWNGAFLHRVKRMYPDCPNAEAYGKKGNQFLVNSISVDRDTDSGVRYDGDLVKDLYIGSNFFDSFALDHHGYLNVGYMVITLSNIAMCYFGCKTDGFNLPQALFHHARELWKVVKTCMFKDGRLIRIGGDTRIRYCYCQDYVIPMLLFVRDYWGDKDADGMLAGIVDMYETEMEHNGDGSFLSDRCAGFRSLSPIYYTRLESDRAAVLSMLRCWDGMSKGAANANDPVVCTEAYDTWKEEFHQAVAVRGKNRFASLCMRGATGPLALCLPMDHSDLAEWDYNLIGQIRGAAGFTRPADRICSIAEFEGGFAGSGSLSFVSDHFMAENQKSEITATLQFAVAALPDDATMVVMQRAVSPERIYVLAAMGLKLNVPNDVYNAGERTYFYDNEYHVVQGLVDGEQIHRINQKYINVDDLLSVYGGYGSEYTLYKPSGRNVGILVGEVQDKVHESATNSFHCDHILKNLQKKPRWYDKGAVIFDEGAVVRVGLSACETKVVAEKQLMTEKEITVEGTGLLRSIAVSGADGETYLVAVNFGKETSPLHINGGKFTDVTNHGECPKKLDAGQVVVCKKSRN